MDLNKSIEMLCRLPGVYIRDGKWEGFMGFELLNYLIEKLG